ncbi:glycosyltransferase [Psychroflexus sp. CAK57W]|uniref:glycosyltransferase n=1 Tax=Psychroflexus curvus TaxID=2873595 RepID=UPI001CCE0B22|nr:glycosyltransferase [Psychroflexus curvus]MBZ9787851.1 glycosyltransferase [Psychroflexus curvus]
MLYNTYVIIVTYNAMSWIDRCLQSTGDYPVVVVDNASTDQTVVHIQSNYPKATLLPQNKNLGFGQGNNVGISYALNQGAEHVFLLNQDAYLVVDVLEQFIISEDLKKLRLTDTVKFVGQQSNPFNYYNQFDIFLMTSKEDPFPLVCIEVGMLGKPIICFDKATGTQEVLENGDGKVVPYLSIERMAEAVVEYNTDEELLKNDSIIAKEVFKDFTLEQKCPEIF